MPENICAEEGCPKLAYAKGKCRSHYTRDRARARKATKAANGVVRRRTKYDETKVDLGLTAVVMAGGNYQLAGEASGIPAPTLQDWVSMHPARYMEIKRDKGPMLEAMVIENLRGFMLESERVKLKALHAVEQAIDEGTLKDPGATLKNIAISQGVAGTKVMEMTGRPTAIIEHRSTRELMARLAHLGAIDTTAEELPPTHAIMPATEPPPVTATADSIPEE